MSWAGSTSTLGGDCSGGPCGACKFQRRKCVSGCIFAPYFNSEQGEEQFTAVHKVFGASNLSKLLLKIPMNKRLDAVVTICYEAQARLCDPIYGCVNHILLLEQQVVNLQAEVTNLRTKLVTLEQPVATPQMLMSTPFSISNPPSASIFPSTIELSTLLDTSAQQPWALPQQHQDQHYQPSYQTPAPRASTMAESSRGGNMQALMKEFQDLI